MSTPVFAVGVAPTGEGQLDLFAATEDFPRLGAGYVWRNRQREPDAAWSGWERMALPGSGATSLATIVDPGGHPDLLTVDADAAAWCASWDGFTWSPWLSLGLPGPEWPLGPIAAARHGGTLHVVGPASDDHERAFFYKQRSTTGTWGTWRSLGSMPEDSDFSVTLAGNADGSLEVFSPAREGKQLLHRRLKNSGAAEGPWKQVGSPPGGMPEGFVPVLAENLDGRLELFTPDRQGKIWHRAQDKPSGDWGTWTLLDGNLQEFGQLCAGRATDGCLHLLATRRGTTLFRRVQTTPGGSWGPWIEPASVPGPDIEDPVVVATNDGRLQLHLRLPQTNEIYWRRQAPNGLWPPNPAGRIALPSGDRPDDQPDGRTEHG